MAISYKKRYTNDAEMSFDIASSSELFNVDTFNALNQEGQGVDYANLIISIKDKPSDKFNSIDYNLLSGSDQYGYLMQTYYGDSNSETYIENEKYFKNKIQEAANLKAYQSLKSFDKFIKNTTGILANAFNEGVLGTVEGVINTAQLIFGADYETISKDVTGVATNRESINEWSKKYTAINNNDFVGAINSIATSIAQMSPMIITALVVPPLAPIGTGIYYSALAGNTAQEAITADPTINRWDLIKYTGLVTATEAMTEYLGGKIFGGSTISRLMFGNGMTPKAATALGRLFTDFVSEGSEEFVSEILDSIYYQKFVNPESPTASFSDCLYAGLIGGLTGVIMTGGNIAFTPSLTVTNEGIVSTKYAKDNKLEGKKLSKAQSLILKETLSEVSQISKEDPITQLLAKYKDSNLADIELKHGDEYNKALDAKNKSDEKVVKATLALSKILEVVGVENFKKASDLADFSVRERANAIKNFVLSTKPATVVNQVIKAKFETANPGETINIRTDLSDAELDIQQTGKANGKNILFVDFGINPNMPKIQARYGMTVSEDTVLIQKDLYKTKGLSFLLDTAKHELIHTLQMSGDILTAEIKLDLLNQIQQDYTAQTGKKLTGVELDRAYAKDTLLTKVSEAQANSLSGLLLFDDFTIDKIFLTNNSLFSKVFNWLKFQSNQLFKFGKKNDLNKAKYNVMLKSIEKYKKSISNNIGNAEDIQKVANLTDNEIAKLIDAMLPDYSNEHFTLLTGNRSLHSQKLQAAIRFLESGRPLINQGFNFNYQRIFSPDYYKPSFVELVLKGEDEKNFQRNLQEYMINTFNFTINPKDNCLLECIDYNLVVTKDFDMDMSDLKADSKLINQLSNKYRTLSDIFDEKFNTKFILQDGHNNLTDVTLNFINRKSDSNLKAEYNYFTKTINIYVDDSIVYDDSSIADLKHKIYHETTHALGDIQGLSNGTSPKEVRSALVKLNNNKKLEKLSKMLLQESFYNDNLGNINALLDNTSYAIYKLSDGEYTAESYKTATGRKGDNLTILKGGATLNRSGFYVTDKAIIGYGRFAEFVLPLTRVENAQMKYAIENIRKTSEVAAYQKSAYKTTIETDLEKMGVKLINFEKASKDEKEAFKNELDKLNFSADFANAVADNEMDDEKLKDLINTENIAKYNATEEIKNKLMTFAINAVLTTSGKLSTQKYITNAENLKLAKSVLPFLMALENINFRKSFKSIKSNEPIPFDFMTMEKYGELVDALFAPENDELLGKVRDDFDESSKDRLNMWLINKDFDGSLKQVGDFIKYSRMKSSFSKDVSINAIEGGENLFREKTLTPEETLINKESLLDDAKNTEYSTFVYNIRQIINKQLDLIDSYTTLLSENISEERKLDINKKLITAKKTVTTQLTQIINALEVNKEELIQLYGEEYADKTKVTDITESKEDRITRLGTEKYNQLINLFPKEYRPDTEDYFGSSKERNVLRTAIQRQIDNLKKLIDVNTTDPNIRKYLDYRLGDSTLQEIKDFKTEITNFVKEYKTVPTTVTEPISVVSEETVVTPVETPKEVITEPIVNEEPVVETPKEPSEKKTTDIIDNIMNTVEYPDLTATNVQLAGEKYKSSHQFKVDSYINFVSQAVEFLDSINGDNFDSIMNDLESRPRGNIYSTDSYNISNILLYLSSATENDAIILSDEQRNRLDTAVTAILRVSGQQLNAERQAMRIAIDSVKPVTYAVTEWNKMNETNYSVPEDLIKKYSDYDEKSLESKIKDLTEQINKETNLDKKSELIKQRIDTQKIYKAFQDKTFNALADKIYNNLYNEGKFNEAKELATDVAKQMNESLETREKIKFKDLTPEQKKERLHRWAKKLKQYRFFALLSKPSTLFRNKVNNTLLTVLNKISDFFASLIRIARKGKELVILNVGKVSNDSVDYTKKTVIDTGLLDYILATGNKFTGLDEGVILNVAQDTEKLFGIKFLSLVDRYYGWVKKHLNGDDRTSIGKSTINYLNHALTDNKSILIEDVRENAYSSYRVSSDQDLQDLYKTNPSEGLKSILSALDGNEADIYNNLSKSKINDLLTASLNMSLEIYLRNDNKVSKFIQELANKNPALDILISGMGGVFIRAASNIMGTMYRYSPAGFISVLHQAITNKGYSFANQFGVVDDLSASRMDRRIAQAVTGSMGIIFGIILHALGLLDYDEDDYMGTILRIGDFKVQLSDLAPALSSITLGVGVAQLIQKGEFSALANSIYDETLLGNLNNIIQYNSSLKDILGDIAENYIAQYIPSLVRSMSRVIDPYTKSKSTNNILRFLQDMIDATPFRIFLANKIDPYTGEAIKRFTYGSWIEIADVFSPIRIIKSNDSELEKLAKSLNTETTGFTGTFTINGEKLSVDPQTKEPLARFRANYVSSQMSLITDNKQAVTIERNGKMFTTKWDNLTDDEKTKVLKSVYSKSTDVTKIQYWLTQGNYYYETDKDSYLKYKSLFLNSKYMYKPNSKGSKFVSK